MFFSLTLLILLSRFVLTDFTAGFCPASRQPNSVANVLLQLIIAANFECAPLVGFQYIGTFGVWSGQASGHVSLAVAVSSLAAGASALALGRRGEAPREC